MNQTRFRQIAESDTAVDMTDDGIPMQALTLDALERFRYILSEKLGFNVTTDQTVAWMLKQQGVSANAYTFTKHDGNAIPIPSGMTKADLKVIEDHAVKGDKILAIKEARSRCKDPVSGAFLGLKEAKDFVEKHWFGNPNNVA